MIKFKYSQSYDIIEIIIKGIKILRIKNMDSFVGIEGYLVRYS